MVFSMHGMMRNVCNTSARQRKAKYPYENVWWKIKWFVFKIWNLKNSLVWLKQGPSAGDAASLFIIEETFWAVKLLPASD
jgi:hypothetical protein